MIIQQAVRLPFHFQTYRPMSTILISLLRNIGSFEHIRAAVCAAQEYRRELCDTPPEVKTLAGAIAL